MLTRFVSMFSDLFYPFDMRSQPRKIRRVSASWV